MSSFLQAYDPELFSKALPCLSAIGCALSPDYALTHQDDNLSKPSSYDTDGPYVPRPVDTNRSVAKVMYDATPPCVSYQMRILLLQLYGYVLLLGQAIQKWKVI